MTRRVSRREGVATTTAYKPPRAEPAAVQVECVFFGPLREPVGEKTVHREAEGSVGDLLRALEADYPDLDLLEDGALRADVAVTVEKQHLQHLDGLETELSDGDVVRITTAVYGGCLGRTAG